VSPRKNELKSSSAQLGSKRDVKAKAGAANTLSTATTVHNPYWHSRDQRTEDRKAVAKMGRCEICNQTVEGSAMTMRHPRKAAAKIRKQLDGPNIQPAKANSGGTTNRRERARGVKFN
jgi:hypothetical protein